MKQCYIRLSTTSPCFHDNKYVQVSLLTNDDGHPLCYLSGVDDWELSYTGARAGEKFEALLAICEDVSWQQLIDLGFTQYG